MAIKPCCRKAENLVRTHLGPDRHIDKCRVCGARHFRIKAEPGSMGLRIKPLGKKKN